MPEALTFTEASGRAFDKNQMQDYFVYSISASTASHGSSFLLTVVPVKCLIVAQATSRSAGDTGPRPSVGLAAGKSGSQCILLFDVQPSSFPPTNCHLRETPGCCTGPKPFCQKY